MTFSLLTSIGRHGFGQTLVEYCKNAKDSLESKPKPKYAHIRRRRERVLSEHRMKHCHDDVDIDIYRQTGQIHDKERKREVTKYKRIFGGGPAVEVVQIAKEEGRDDQRRAEREDVGKKKLGADRIMSKKRLVKKGRKEGKIPVETGRSKGSLFEDDNGDHLRDLRDGKSSETSSNRQRSGSSVYQKAVSHASESQPRHSIRSPSAKETRSRPHASNRQQRASKLANHQPTIFTSAHSCVEENQTLGTNTSSSRWKQPFLNDEQSVEFIFGAKQRTPTIRKVIDVSSAGPHGHGLSMKKSDNQYTAGQNTHQSRVPYSRTLCPNFSPAEGLSHTRSKRNQDLHGRQ